MKSDLQIILGIKMVVSNSVSCPLVQCWQIGKCGLQIRVSNGLNTCPMMDNKRRKVWTDQNLSNPVRITVQFQPLQSSFESVFYSLLELRDTNIDFTGNLCNPKVAGL